MAELYTVIYLYMFSILDFNHTYPWFYTFPKLYNLNWCRKCSSYASSPGGSWQSFMAWVPNGSAMQIAEPWKPLPEPSEEEQKKKGQRKTTKTHGFVTFVFPLLDICSMQHIHFLCCNCFASVVNANQYFFRYQFNLYLSVLFFFGPDLVIKLKMHRCF